MVQIRSSEFSRVRVACAALRFPNTLPVRHCLAEQTQFHAFDSANVALSANAFYIYLNVFPCYLVENVTLM